MAIGVVEVFEIVEVENDDSDSGAFVAGASDQIFDHFLEVPTVGQSGQCVGVGQFLQSVPGRSQPHESGDQLIEISRDDRAGGVLRSRGQFDLTDFLAVFHQRHDQVVVFVASDTSGMLAEGDFGPSGFAEKHCRPADPFEQILESQFGGVDQFGNFADEQLLRV